MSGLIPFDEYLGYIAKLEKTGLDLSETGGRCAYIYNTEWHNLQGHVKQSFYGVQRFLQENPQFMAGIAQSNINSPYAITGELLKIWKHFLKTHRKEKTNEYDLGVLYNIIPRNYGGRTTSGGGAIAFIGRSFPVVARMMISGSFAIPDIFVEPDSESTKKQIRFRKETILRRIRDTEKTRQLKVIYDYVCQICHTPGVQIGPDKHYVEGHHLRPLGRPHDGEDNKSNIVILCPNHHVMFDRCVMAIDPRDGKTVLNKFFKSTTLLIKHKLDPDNINYHYQAYISC